MRVAATAWTARRGYGPTEISFGFVMAGLTSLTAQRTSTMTARWSGVRTASIYERDILMAKRAYYHYGVVRWLNDEGRCHRLDGPAEVWADSSQFWWRHGRYHFAHGPADLCYGGMLLWYEGGQFLRMRDPYG